jgi:[acyl-carrier-protein] S-malonyltransferase
MSRIGLLFPGQGSQYPGMGIELAARSPIASELFRRASESLGWDVLAACGSGSMELLTRGDVAQPAIVAVGAAFYHHFVEEARMKPDFLAGHSLGEITALACAGAFDLETGLRLARLRGEIMREAASKEPGSMCALLGASGEEVARACSEHDRPGSRVVISNENAWDQLVVSGHREAVEAVCRSLSVSGVKIRPIEVEGAFHSPLMAEAAKRFGKHLADLRPREPAITVLSSVTGRPHGSAGAIPFLLKRQVVEPVRWRSCFDFLVLAGVKLFFECGPGSVLTRLARRARPGLEAFSLDRAGEYAAPPDFAKIPAKGKDFMALCLAAAAGSADHGEASENSSREGAPAYRELERLRLKVLEENRPPTEAELSRSLALAELILELKQAPARLAEVRARARLILTTKDKSTKREKNWH